MGPWLDRLLILVVGVIVWVVVRGSRPRVFVVRLAGGEPDVGKGAVPPAFLQRVREVAAEPGIASDRVWGKPKNGRVRVGFSATIPAADQHQLRNW